MPKAGAGIFALQRDGDRFRPGRRFDGGARAIGIGARTFAVSADSFSLSYSSKTWRAGRKPAALRTIASG